MPVEIDGLGLSEIQACRVLPELVGKAMDVGHDMETAKTMAVEAFRKMYTRTEDGWTPKRTIRLGKGGGVSVRNKFHRSEERKMGRSRATEPKVPPSVRMAESIQEAGARNSKKDKDAIKEVVKLALSQLGVEDTLEVLSAAGLKVKVKK